MFPISCSKCDEPPCSPALREQGIKLKNKGHCEESQLWRDDAAVSMQ